MPTTAMVQHVSERKRGQQLSAPNQSDGAMACTGCSGKAKPPRRYRKIRGYSHQPPYNPRIPAFKALRDCAAQQEAASDRPLKGWNPDASHPRKGKTLKSPPIGRFSEFSRRATNTTDIRSQSDRPHLRQRFRVGYHFIGTAASDSSCRMTGSLNCWSATTTCITLATTSS